MGDFPLHLHQQKARIWAIGCEDRATEGDEFGLVAVRTEPQGKNI